MPKYKVQQHRLPCGSRSFHFVSYEAQVANARRGHVEMGPMWCLMRAGKRWPAIPHVVGQPDVEVRQALLRWLESQGMNRVEVSAAQATAPRSSMPQCGSLGRRIP